MESMTTSTRQKALADRVRELEEALAQIEVLRGILPICSYCKKVRNDDNYWQGLEQYIAERSSAQFSHGICPECYERYVEPEVQKLRARSSGPEPPDVSN